MPARRLLLLDATHLTAYAWHGGHIDPEGEFAADPTGVEAFGRYLKKHARSLFYLIVDIAEEGFQIDDIPHVTGSDRSALLKRRIGQYYYGTPYAAALSLGREKTGRRDEKILFAALTRPPHIDPWMAALADAATQLGGLYSMPLVVAKLFQTAPEIRQGRHLLLTLGRGGLRQTFFDEGNFRFSRLTSLATGSAEEYAVACTIESEKIYQYLVGQRLIDRGTRLNATILLDPGLVDEFRHRCNDTADICFHFLDLNQAARKHGLKSQPTHKFHSDWLFLHSVVRRTPGHQLAPEAALRHYRVWQLKTGINAAAMIGLAACAVLSLKYAIGIYSLEGRSAQIKTQIAAETQRYEAMLKTLPPIPLKVDALRGLIGRFDEMEKRSPSLADTYRRLSRALDTVPEVELQRIDWSLSPKPEGASERASGGSYFALVDIQAQLPPTMLSNHRGMLDAVNRFAAELGKDSTLDVKIVRMPFDTESGKTIRSSADAPTAQRDPPGFSVHIVQRIF